MSNRVNKHVARHKKVRNSAKAIDAIATKVTDGDWTSEQGMDAIKKLADGGDTQAKSLFDDMQLDGYGTTAQSKDPNSGFSTIGYITGPNANPLPADTPDVGDFDSDDLNDLAA